jgi:hypothetical protein
MPYSKCPICGGISHLNVSDIEQWYRENYSEIEVGSLVPGKCFFCWQELNLGDLVSIRDRIGPETRTPIGTAGRLVEVLSAPEHGAIYLVRLESGEEKFFVRGELQKVRENE